MRLHTAMKTAAVVAATALLAAGCGSGSDGDGGSSSADGPVQLTFWTWAPGMEEIFRHNAVCWLGTKAYVIRYEDMVRHLKQIESRQAELYFAGLFDACGISMPADWRTRVAIGADRKQSATARENLEGATDLPDELPEIQKRLVDYAAPGLRALLGYA